jgi:hypothetical protein
MRLRYRIALSVVAFGFAVFLGCVVWFQLQTPESAKADPWMVWISVLKGFGGDVYYVGSKGPYAYFRIGSVFPSYYKTPACNATLPHTFDVGAGKPYIVTLDNVHGYFSSTACDS